MPKTHLLLKAALEVKTLSIASQGEASEQQIRLLEQYTQLRTEYVLQEKWPIHASGIDLDIYDTASNNHYVIAHVKQQVVAGMRLTRVSSLEDSLSYSMWQFALERDKFERELETRQAILTELHTRELWDVTRLITAASIAHEHSHLTRAHSRVGLFRVMAEGMSIAAKTHESVWVCTVAEKMLHFMQRNGMTVDVLASGRISASDAHDSYLCIARPLQILESIAKTKPMLYLVVRRNTK